MQKISIEKIIQWANNKNNIRVIMLTGSLAGNGRTDALSDYDIAVYGNDFGFITEDKWLKEINDYLVCIHDAFSFQQHIIPTRLVIFNTYFKVDFSFHPLEILYTLVTAETLPDEYNVGYKILVDKDGFAKQLSKPTYEGFVIKKPTGKAFENNMNKFFFEVYHTAKYLHRGDLWTAKLRDNSARKWLLQMLEWNKAAKYDWCISVKNNGRDMKNWLDETTWQQLHHCFATFEAGSSRKALHHTVELYLTVTRETAAVLQYYFNEKLSDAIIQFIQTEKIS